MVQWLGRHTLTAKGPGSIPSLGTKIPTSHMAWPKKSKGYHQEGEKEQRNQESPDPCLCVRTCAISLAWALWGRGKILVYSNGHKT